MYQNILKAGKTEQYFTVAAMTSYLKEKEKYEGLLLIKEKGEVCSKYGASEFESFQSESQHSINNSNRLRHYILRNRT